MRVLSTVLGSLVLALVAAGVVGRPAGVEAGTAVRMDVSDLARESELIVEAHVLSSVVVETDRAIETEHLLEVRRTLAGQDLPYRALRVPGGVLDDGRGMQLAGMPRILPGEDVLLFLGPEGTGGLRMPVGLAQGKFTVVQRPGGGKQLVQDAGAVVLVDPDSGSLRRGEGRTVLDYAEVIARIEAARAVRRGR